MQTRIGSVMAFALAVAALGCGSDTAPAPVPARLEVYGRDIGVWGASISVWRDGAPVNDATVLVNGQVIPRSGAATGHEDGLYDGYLEPVLSAGETVHLEVTSGGSSVVGVGTIPASPALTSPSGGATFAAGDDVVVTWTSPSDPDYFEVSATWSCGAGCGTGAFFESGGSTRTLTIPAGSLPGGQSVGLTVYAYDDGALTGDYTPHAPYPGMNIRTGSSSVTVSH